MNLFPVDDELKANSLMVLRRAAGLTQAALL